MGPLDHQQLSTGDVVKVELDTEVLKLMQADHGGWNDAMATVCQLRYTYTAIMTRANASHFLRANESEAATIAKFQYIHVFIIGDYMQTTRPLAKCIFESNTTT